MSVDPNQPAVRLWRKAGDGSWSRRIIKGLDAEIDLSQVGVTLRMSDVYDGVAFPRGTRPPIHDDTTPMPGR